MGLTMSRIQPKQVKKRSKPITMADLEKLFPLEPIETDRKAWQTLQENGTNCYRARKQDGAE